MFCDTSMFYSFTFGDDDDSLISPFFLDCFQCSYLHNHLDMQREEKSMENNPVNKARLGMQGGEYE